MSGAVRVGGLGLLLASLLFSGCGMSLYTSPSEKKAQLRDALDAAMEASDGERVEALADAYLKFEMSPEERVWLRSELLLLALANGDEATIAARVELLAAAMPDFIPDRQAAALTNSERARRQSELALRKAQAWAFALLASDQSAYAQGNDSRRRLEQELSQLVLQATELEAERQRLERVSSLARASAGVAKAALSASVSREQARLDELVVRHTAAIAALDERAQNLANQREQKKQQEAALQQELADEQAKVDEASTAVETARQQLTQVQEAQDNLVTQAQGVQETAASAEKAAKQAQDEAIKVRTGELRSADAELSVAQKQLKQVESKGEKEKARLEAALSKANAAHRASELSFEEADAKKAAQQAERDGLEKERDESLATLRSQLEGALEESKPALEKELAQAEASFEKRLAAAEKGLGLAEQRYAAANEAEGQARSAADEARRAYDEGVQSLDQELASAQQQLSDAQSKRSAVQQAQDALVAEAEAVHTEQKRALEASNEALRQAKATRDADLGAAKAQLSERSEALKAAEKSQASVKKRVASELKGIEKALALLDKDQAKLEQERALSEQQQTAERAEVDKALAEATASFDGAVSYERTMQNEQEQALQANEQARQQKQAAMQKTRSELELVQAQSGEEAKLFLTATNAYLSHHGDAILVAEVLWNQAQVLGFDDRPMEAIAVYRKILGLDFTGEYSQRAFDAIAGAYLQASESTDLPTPSAERQEIASPHLEWVNTAQQMLKANPQHPEALSLELRIADISRAYGQLSEEEHLLARIALREKYAELDADAAEIERARVFLDLKQEKQAYVILEAISDSDSERAVEAAIVWLEHVAAHGSVTAFRRLRKDLAANKKLWASEQLRARVAELRKQVEGD
ncbi:MAG: hypothetical protein RBU37_21710 [Myxococcota bacterium]|jgi:hypothetical protein|nr:hypothetical protein [Myxococcota bacterium]